MNRSLLFCLLTIFFFGLSAQQNVPQRTCGTDILPAQYETWVQSVTPKAKPGKYGTANVQSVFNIPVIVHIIHNNEPVNSVFATSGNNLNAAQVIDQINILNKDFNGLNADTNLIPAVFKPLLGKFQVNFCLAVVNPTGGVLAEPGIDRINRVSKGWTNLPYTMNYIDATVKPNSIWNPNLYLNMWVTDLGGGLLGYATFPNPSGSGLQGLTGSFGTASTDGVVILNTSFGSIGTAQFGQYNKGRTTTHEIGHWIGLRHIWGDSNCGTDYCNDTPPAQSANYGCPSFPFQAGTCTGNTTGEMTMNFMDYTDDACMQMFTADQKYRAQVILTNSPMRAALITSTVCNLPAVGNDIGITYVSRPTYSQSISCVNYINPVIHVTNFGSTSLTSALFTYNVDGVNTQTLSWTGTMAPNTSFTLALPQVSGLAAGAHVFSVNVSAPNGGGDNNLSNNNNLQNFKITSTMTLNASSGTICQGGSVILTASGATTYSWNTGVTTATISLSPATTTTYTVTGTTGLCSAVKVVTVSIQGAPTLSLNKTSVCAGKPTLITVSGANSYTWTNGGTSPTTNVNLLSPATYTIKGMSSAGCISTQTFNILVNALPTLSTTSSYVTCSSCSDGMLAVYASGGTAPYSYLWMPGNITTQTAAGLPVGCYTVTVADALGCSAVDSKCVSFDTGIFGEPVSTPFIKLMPNPTKGEVVIHLELSGTKKIRIVDALGKLVYTGETDSDQLNVNLIPYASGVYYVQVLNSDRYTVIKLLKN